MAGDWIEWSGGECPVDPETIVETKLVDGSIWVGASNVSAAKFWAWGRGRHTPNKDIIAYRVVKP